jgi:hypothetical protein
MIGRRGGRIGVDRYPRILPAQGVWRLNEIYFEKRFNSWPVDFYPGFVTPFNHLKIDSPTFWDIVESPGALFGFSSQLVMSVTQEFSDTLTPGDIIFPAVTITSGVLS